jgi:hypothetical protein
MSADDGPAPGLGAPSDDPAADREALYRGQILCHPASPASLHLADSVWQRLLDAFPEADPQQAQFVVDPDQFFKRLTAVRRAVLADSETPRLIREVLRAQGADLEQTYFDLLRVRAVNSGGHRRAAAAAAYVVHRDTWYANPAAQINWWLPLRDATAAECFAFHPDWYTRPIRNSSAGFSYRAWNQLGGWQSPHPDKVYPTALEPVTGTLLQVPRARGELLRFSGTHLHGTAPHDSGRTRFSVDFRVVHLPDVARLQHERLLDSQARGSTLGDFLRASDFAAFPPALLASLRLLEA